jgi:hypothetical protein
MMATAGKKLIASTTDSTGALTKKLMRANA